MKKQYEKPAMCVVQIQHQNRLLAGSPVQSRFVDETDSWDSGGGQ